jgi:trehalose-6-phosphatase
MSTKEKKEKKKTLIITKFDLISFMDLSSRMHQSPKISALNKMKKQPIIVAVFSSRQMRK